jgi:hypothetical protein
LLGNRAGAVGALAIAHQVCQRCARDAEDVDAPMRVELPILDGHDRVDHVVRDLMERHQRAVLDVELADHGTVVGEDLCLERGLDELEARGAGQVAGEIAIGREHRPGKQDDDPDQDLQRYGLAQRHHKSGCARLAFHGRPTAT